MDPQAPQPPNPEPTPASPAPSQTSPVTPGSASAPGSSPPPTDVSTHNGNKKLIAAMIAAVAVVSALVFLFLSPWSPFVSAAPKGPKMLLGKKQYVYPCSVLNKELVSKQLNIKLDPNKENVEEYYAFDPANTKNKEVDLIKLADTSAVTSICTLKLDRMQEGTADKQTTSFINVGLSLEQFPEDDDASKAFNIDKSQIKNAKTVPSFDDNSYFGPPRVSSQQGGATTVQAKVLHKNILVTLTAPSDDSDSDGTETAAKLEALFKDTVSRIDKGEGLKYKNFNKANEINGNNFVDACGTINFAKVVQAMGNGTELYAPRVNSTQAYAPDNNKGQTPSQLASTCAFSFRTQAEINAAKNAAADGSGGNLAYAEKFPHYFSTQLAVTESNEKAQEYIAKVKAEAEKNAQENPSESGGATEVKDITLGDSAIHMSLRQEFPAQNPEETDSATVGNLYYVAKGPRLYVFSTSYLEQSKPYASKSYNLNNDQLQKIFKELMAAPKRAR